MSDDKKITVLRAAATADEGQSNVTNTVSIAEESPNRNRKVKGPSRMISEAIITSGRFLKLSDKAKVLYMYLMVRTDDEGVVEAYPAMMFAGAQENALNELIGKRFVKRLNEDDVVFVCDFYEQNTLRADRTKLSRYHDLIADSCPQNAAACQPNLIQSSPTEVIPSEDSSIPINPSDGQQEADKSDDQMVDEDDSNKAGYDPIEEEEVPYIYDHFLSRFGITEGETSLILHLADGLQTVERASVGDPEGSGYLWLRNYICIKCKKMEHQAENKRINSPFLYLREMVEQDLRAEGSIPQIEKDNRKAG